MAKTQKFKFNPSFKEAPAESLYIFRDVSLDTILRRRQALLLAYRNDDFIPLLKTLKR